MHPGSAVPGTSLRGSDPLRAAATVPASWLGLAATTSRSSLGSSIRPGERCLWLEWGRRLPQCTLVRSECTCSRPHPPPHHETPSALNHWLLGLPDGQRCSHLSPSSRGSPAGFGTTHEVKEAYIKLYVCV